MHSVLKKEATKTTTTTAKQPPQNPAISTPDFVEEDFSSQEQKGKRKMRHNI